MHLGSIGTGNFEIGADGQLTTWQLFNTLRDGQVPFYFALQVGKIARFLQTAGGPDWPRINRIQMTGEYPLATLRFEDQELPVGLELAAFSPFAPLNVDFSSLPLAVFRFRITNPAAVAQTVSLAALMTNPVGYEADGLIQDLLHPKLGGNVNEIFHEGPATGLWMRADRDNGPATKSPGFGTLALATTGPSVTALSHFEDWSEAWKMFSDQGSFLPLASATPNAPTAAGQTINAALATTVAVPAHSSIDVPFFLTWHYPNAYFKNKTSVGCYYATQWADARAVIHAAAADDALTRKTQLFRDTFYDSTLPYWLLDCITADSGILRHIGVVFRIANGDIYGWEGSNGCCDPTCTHVWGYEQSLAHLFPELERDMRRIDFMPQQTSDGGVNNRTAVPSPAHPTGEHPFTDGHASCILKAYREALNSPDDSFFRQYWPNVKRAVEYLIARDAKTSGVAGGSGGSGGQPAGILQDDQWNTYDEALHGVTTFISGYYLAALRAGEEWARRMGDAATADRFHAIFEAGQKKIVELCWNGEYFQQHFPLYMQHKGEVGPGCMSDQLIGQWWAHQLGLGYVLPQDKVASALRSIFKYNWKSDLTGWKHAPRAFAGAHDKGLIICTWPKGGRPAHVMLYSDEVWTGIEYQVAAHMIYEGMVEEGYSIVKGTRDRYDGIPRPPIGRNPWSEIECGGHYARAMSSWSLLPALSGFEYDGPRGTLRFAPRYNPDDFKSFFVAAEGWGSLAQKTTGGTRRVEITVKSGKLRLTALELAAFPNENAHGPLALLAGKTLLIACATRDGRCHINFDANGIAVNEGETLEIKLT